MKRKHAKRFPSGENGFLPVKLAFESDLPTGELADLRDRQSRNAKPPRPRIKNRSRWVFSDYGPHGEAHPRNRKAAAR